MAPPSSTSERLTGTGYEPAAGAAEPDRLGPPAFPHPAPFDAAAHAARGLARWQRGLLPVMVAALATALLAFLILSFVEAGSVRRRITGSPVLDLAPVLSSVSCKSATSAPAELQACLQWKIAVLLEQHTIARRYHQANVALIVRASVKYLGFLTGMLLAIVGAAFVLGRLTEPPSKLSAEGKAISFALDTASPGLVLAVLGTVLMIATLFVNPPTDVADANVYLRPPEDVTSQAPAPAPTP